MPYVETLIGRLRRALPSLRSDTRGNVAILFGLSVIPVAGLVGAALDYNRALEFRTFMLNESDAAALSIAAAETPNAEGVISSLKQRLAAHYGTGSVMISNVAVNGSWVASSDYTLATSADLKMTLVSVVPGVPKSIPVAVTTTVKRKPAQWQWSLPSIKDLSNEAHDYNRISVYCYNESKKNEANKGRRLETLTPIADNYGTNYSGSKLPTCQDGETLSFKLWNVRSGKAPGSPQNLKWWQKNAQGQDPETYRAANSTVLSARYPTQTDYYSFYTDTTIEPNSRVLTNKVSGGKEDASGNIANLSDVTSSPIMESVICTTGVDCKSTSEGGVLPNAGIKNKMNPQTATGACADGKSIFYGWEDRPPSAGGSDRDYDDIRIVVSCPSLIKIADKEIRIVK